MSHSSSPATSLSYPTGAKSLSSLSRGEAELVLARHSPCTECTCTGLHPSPGVQVIGVPRRSPSPTSSPVSGSGSVSGSPKPSSSGVMAQKNPLCACGHSAQAHGDQPRLSADEWARRAKVAIRADELLADTGHALHLHLDLNAPIETEENPLNDFMHQELLALLKQLNLPRPRAFASDRPRHTRSHSKVSPGPGEEDQAEAKAKRRKVLEKNGSPVSPPSGFAPDDSEEAAEAEAGRKAEFHPHQGQKHHSRGAHALPSFPSCSARGGEDRKGSSTSPASRSPDPARSRPSADDASISQATKAAYDKREADYADQASKGASVDPVPSEDNVEQRLLPPRRGDDALQQPQQQQQQQMQQMQQQQQQQQQQGGGGSEQVQRQPDTGSPEHEHAGAARHGWEDAETRREGRDARGGGDTGGDGARTRKTEGGDAAQEEGGDGAKQVEEDYEAMLARLPPIQEKPAALEEQAGLIQFRIVRNDGRPESGILLTGLKNIFQRQLPKMPREYITRLVFDRTHVGLAIVKRGLQVVGGITYKPFPQRAFAEIVFCAITGTEQVKGYGSHLMNHLKSYVRRTGPVMHFLTYADNYAIGYFKKQGFSKDITLPRAVWTGYIKDYEGGTLMQCSLVPRVEYLAVRRLLQRQEALVRHRMTQFSRSHIVHGGLDVFRRAAPKTEHEPAGMRVAPEAVPGLREAGWTPAMDELARRPKRGPHHSAMRQILSELGNHAAAWPFQNPVSAEDVPDYYDVVRHPMDLATLETNLENNKYASLAQFLADTQLIFDNCRFYNPPQSPYAKSANRLEKFLRDNLQAWKQAAGVGL